MRENTQKYVRAYGYKHVEKKGLFYVNNDVQNNVKEKVMVTEESAVTSLADEIEAAREALLEAAEKDPTRWWSARELRDACRNGWAPAAVMIALNRLVAEERFERDERFFVRLVA